MRGSLAKLTWVEIKLFLREPVTVIFTLALPLMVLYVLGGVFGNEAAGGGGDVVYRGYGPTDFYTPAYVALAVAGVALIGVPAHLVEYREIGVLRRFRASSVRQWDVLVSQLVVSLVIATVGAGLLVTAAFLFTDVTVPQAPGLFLVAYGLGAVALAVLGLLLGTVLPSARAAQSVGLLLWFVFMFLSGAGPPPEVLPSSLRTIGDWLPFTPVVELLQEPWLRGGWATTQSLVVAALVLVAAGIAWWAYRWE
ncbi:MAG TPA: ABC transporter permease [Acidimicrobiia bacterium]